jgi:uncharacterized membrane protein YjgN (DUF898 family)
MDTLIHAQPAGDAGAPALPQIERHRPQFSGRTGEYFGIWFVNLLLSIVTLGIYSAWAKVRTQRYFYGNTRLAGASFDYLADPISILKGRLIAYAFVISLGLSARFSVGLYAALLVFLFFAMPAVMVLSLRFRARNSAWRGVTFGFDESVGAAYGPFLGWPILSSLTFSLLYPSMKMRQHEFVLQGHRFGKARFSFHGELGDYWKVYGVMLCLGLVGIVGFVVMSSMLRDGGVGDANAMLIGFFLVFYAGFFAAMIFLRVRFANLFWSNARLGDHRFESTLRARDMLWLYASNAVVILCTIGLGVPWAMMRLARYRAEHFAVVANGSLEGFVAESSMKTGAAGAELVDALDTGLDFGF